MAAVLAFIYDYCYDQLSTSLKSQIVALMNDYYDGVSVNGYQAQDFSHARCRGLRLLLRRAAAP